MTDIFWFANSSLIDSAIDISDSFLSYFNDPRFLRFFDGKIEYALAWHLMQKNIYEKVEYLDWIKCPVVLDRFINTNNQILSGIKRSGTGCLPFTGWKKHNTYEEKDFKLHTETIDKNIKRSIEGK